LALAKGEHVDFWGEGVAEIEQEVGGLFIVEVICTVVIVCYLLESLFVLGQFLLVMLDDAFEL
jgi:hypothetical protein